MTRKQIATIGGAALALLFALVLLRPTFAKSDVDPRIVGMQTTIGYALSFPNPRTGLPHVDWYWNGSHARTDLDGVILHAR